MIFLLRSSEDPRCTAFSLNAVNFTYLSVYVYMELLD